MASFLSMSSFGVAQVMNPSFALLYEQNHVQEHHLSAAFVFESTIIELKERADAIWADIGLRFEEIQELSLQFDRLFRDVSFYHGSRSVNEDVYTVRIPVTQDVYRSPSVSDDVYGSPSRNYRDLYDILEEVVEIHRFVEQNFQELMGIREQLHQYRLQAEEEVNQSTIMYEFLLSMEGKVSEEVFGYQMSLARQQIEAAERVFDYVQDGVVHVDQAFASSAEQMEVMHHIVEELESKMSRADHFSRREVERQEVDPIVANDEEPKRQDTVEEELEEDIHEDQNSEDKVEDIAEEVTEEIEEVTEEEKQIDDQGQEGLEQENEESVEQELKEQEELEDDNDKEVVGSDKDQKEPAEGRTEHSDQGHAEEKNDRSDHAHSADASENHESPKTIDRSTDHSNHEQNELLLQNIKYFVRNKENTEEEED